MFRYSSGTEIITINNGISKETQLRTVSLILYKNHINLSFFLLNP